ncbi:MAG: prephenate dehydratase [Clostridiales bacterium]|nr:prephenate dehydratase [Clostridiales bacterium]
MLKIACLGPKGTFTSSALKKFMRVRGGMEEGKSYEIVFAGSVRGIIEKASATDVDFAFCPIENSLEGDISATLDGLAFNSNLYITSEYIMGVEQNLLAARGAGMSDIKAIFSHPQAIGQCADFIEKNFGGNIEIIQTASTATAAQMVERSARAAAIGDLELAEKYGLDVLRRDIQDNDSNATRFVTVEKKRSNPVKDAKTSIVFAVQHRAGELHKMLSIFHFYDINMLQITSRPAKTVLGEYLFFVDIQGDSQDENVARALDVIRGKTLFFRDMGSYEQYAEEKAE